MLSKCPCYQCPRHSFLCKRSCEEWDSWHSEQIEGRELESRQRHFDQILREPEISASVKAREQRHRRVCGW